MTPPVSTSSGEPAGVYILANDRVLEFAKCLFQSLRHFNPTLPAYLIPFDDRMEEITRLAATFHIGVYDAPHAAELDAMAAERFGETGAGQRMFRKFTAYWGPLETFLYLDVDIAILDDPAKLLADFQKAQCDFLSFDRDETRAYRPGPFREQMEREYHSQSFNAGAFISRRGLFDLEAVKRLAREAVPIKNEFAIYGDQSFFNFAVDRARLHQRRLPDAVPGTPEKTWGDQFPIDWKNGAYRILDPRSGDFEKPIPFIHWSGHTERDNFPNREIFYRFRLADATAWEKCRYRMADQWRWKVLPKYYRIKHLCRRALQRLHIIPT